MGDFKKIGYIFDTHQKIRLTMVGLLIIIGSLFELIGVTSILPFIEVAINPNSIFDNKWLHYGYEFLGSESPSQFLIALAVALIAVYILKNIYLSLMTYAIYRFAYNNQRKIALRIHRAYMKQPYTFFLDHNSSELFRNIDVDVPMLFDTVLSALQLMVELFVCSLLLIYLLIMDKTITIVVGIVMVIAFFVVVRALKRDLRDRGTLVRECKTDMSKCLYQSFGAVKELKISGREKFFTNLFDRYYGIFAHNHCIYQTFSYVPKPMMETLCVCSLLGVVALKLMRGVDSKYFITTMSVFAVAAFRLLPAFNRITGYVSHIMFNHSAVDSIYKDLKEIEEIERRQEKIQDAQGTISFKDRIVLKNISYRYPNVDTDVIRSADLEIPYNKSVAFVGPSGAGKTTIADIILGLLSPKEGAILVDGTDVSTHIRQWRNMLGYIPQSIHLNDDTIRRNIAFAIEDEDIDEDRLNRAIDEAQLREFIDSLEDGADTVIGERGIRLSGGQRQRIGIARALYDDPDILILDEATSALDGDTEDAVMEAINSLAGKKTLLIIAHRLTTIRNCDIVYEVRDKTVTRQR